MVFSWLWRWYRRAPPSPVIIQAFTCITYHRGLKMTTATLTWTPPITRTDGSSLHASDIASANVFDTASATPGTPIGSVTGAIGTFTTGVLSAGVHNFTVVTVDTAGDMSAPSNVASVTVATAPPSAVTNLAATLNM